MTGLSVLMVAPYVPPHLGGLETYAFNVARELVAAHGTRVVFAIPASPGVDTAATEALFGRIEELDLRWLPGQGKVSNTPYGFGWTRHLRSIARNEDIDLVNAHAPVPGLADVARRALADMPFVLTYHSGPMAKGRPLIDAGLRAYERWALPATMSRSDAVIYASNFARDSLRPATAPIQDIIHPAVDSELFSPDDVPPQPSILFVGTLSRPTQYKGLATLLDGLALMRRRGLNAALEVVGGGDDVASYQTMARKLGIESAVTFSGRLRGADLVAAYRRNTVLALPSHQDNFPTVAVEAMACGRPVVASDVGALREMIVDGHNGFLVSAADPGALADRLGKVLSQPALAARLGHAGRRSVVSELTVQQQAVRTMAVYRRVLHRRRPQTTRVAVVAPHYSPQLGGVELYAQRVVKGLRDSARHDVVVLSTNRSRRTVVDTVDNVTVIRLPTLWVFSNTPVHPIWAYQMRKLFAQLNIDVVNSHAPVPGLADVAAFASGARPVAFIYHGGSLLKGAWPVDLVLALYEKLILPRVFRRCAALGAPSPAAASFATGRTVLLPPGVDTSRFTPGLGHPAQNTLLYVGRVDRTSRWKGLDILLQAVALLRTQVSGLALRVVGSGDGVDELRCLADDLGVSDIVTWVGSLQGASLVEEFRAAGAVVLPSTTAAESFGMVLIEGMACGRPVIGSDIGGIPHVIRPGVDGLLVAPGDPRALAQACRSVLLDPDFAAALGKRGRAIAEERWDWSKRLEPIIALIDTLCPRPAVIDHGRGGVAGREVPVHTLEVQLQ